jgi:uncharacterized protein YggE
MTDAPVVAVRGEAMLEVDAEIAELSVTVSTRDADRATTLTRLVERVAAVRAVLDGYPDAIEKRETSQLLVSAETHDSGRDPDDWVVAYHGDAITTVVVIDLGAVGDIMLRVGGLDEVTVHGPSWSVRPGSPVYREARHAAITDAIARARDYAAALGARVTGLVELSDVGASFAGARPLAAMSLAGGGSNQPQLSLDPQRQHIHASIEARFAISEPTVLAEPLD